MDSFESRMNPRFLAESEKRMLWEPRVIESGRETVEGFQEDEKRKSFCFVIIQFELIFHQSCFYVVCACIEFFGEAGHFTERSGFLELCVICKKLMVYRVVSYDIVQDEENGPQYWALRHTVYELWWWWRRVIDWSGLISVWEVQLKPLQCSRLKAKNRVQAGEENLVVTSVKSSRKTQQKKNRWPSGLCYLHWALPCLMSGEACRELKKKVPVKFCVSVSSTMDVDDLSTKVVEWMGMGVLVLLFFGK